MEEKQKDLLARVLDMSEIELKAALITIVNGSPVEEAIDAAYNPIRHGKTIKPKRPDTLKL